MKYLIYIWVLNDNGIYVGNDRDRSLHVLDINLTERFSDQFYP